MSPADGGVSHTRGVDPTQPLTERSPLAQVLGEQSGCDRPEDRAVL
jgi:hypothetical protein